MTLFQSIAVVGAGAWGTALANAAARAGRDILLIARDADHAAEMAASRHNQRRLPGVPLEDRVIPTSDLARVAETRAVLLVTPAQSCAGMAEALGLVLKPGTPVVLCAKGIDRASRLFLGDIIVDALPRQPFAVLSGPSFADDVSRGLPTAVVLASADTIIAEALAAALRAAPCASITAPMCAASRLAGRPRMCWPLPAVPSSGAASARARGQRWWRGALPN